MATLERLRPGQMLFDVGKQRGKTVWWPVVIESVDLEKRTALASWNCNKSRTFNERSIKKFRVNQPKE